MTSGSRGSTSPQSAKGPRVPRDRGSQVAHPLTRAMAWQLGGYAALGLSILLSLSLSPPARGELAATMASSTLAAALAGLSLDTSLPTRTVVPRWLRSPKVRIVPIVGLIAGGAMIGFAIGTFANGAIVGVSAVGGALGIVLTLSTAVALHGGRVLEVQRARAIGSITFLICAAVLVVQGSATAGDWAVVWLLNVMTSTMIVLWGNRGNPASWSFKSNSAFGRNLIVVHVGTLALLLAYRLDQVLLARYGFVAELGQYSVVVAALEASMGPAGIIAQFNLSKHRGVPTLGQDAVRTMRTSAVLAAAIGASIGVTLIVASLIIQSYGRMPLFVVLLLPGIISLSGAKPGSASLTASGRALWSAGIAVTMSVLAVAGFAISIPAGGAAAAAAISTCAYFGVFACTLVAVGKR